MLYDLKPCPFCGGPAEIRGDDAPENWVHCAANCQPSGRDKAALVAAWNTRAPNPAAFAAGAEAMRGRAAEDVERWHVDYAQDMAADIRALPLPTMMGGKLCEDCPPIGYPTDKTRCRDCPRKERT